MFQGKNIGCYFQGKWSLRNELENSILINSLNKHVENLSFNKFSHFLHNFTETICWREYLQKVNCHIITLCQLHLGVSNGDVVRYQWRKMQKGKCTNRYTVIMHLSWEKVFVEAFFPTKIEKVTSFFCMCVTFWYIALPSLHDYNMKLPNATFYGGTLKTQQQIFLPLSKVWIISVPKNSAPGKLKFAFTACKESHVWQPGASGFCYRASDFCS